MADIKDLRVKFNSTKTKTQALSSTSPETIHFTTDGAIVVNGVCYAHQAINATKVSGGIEGNVAKLDSNGNIADSGFKLNKTVPSDAVFTDTKVTAVGNHYTPSADSGSTISNSDTKKVIQSISRDSKGHVTNAGFVTIDKTFVGLSNVTNDAQVKRSEMGVANGVATLDTEGKVPSSQLPSYVDDVLDVILCYENNNKLYYTDSYTSANEIPTPYDVGVKYLAFNTKKIYAYTDDTPQIKREVAAESDKIYIDTRSNKTYRWSGTSFGEISASLALGITSSTAFRGDYGNTAYQHATDSNKLTTAKSEGLYKIGVTAQGHVSSATAVTKADITSLGIADTDRQVTAEQYHYTPEAAIGHTINLKPDGISKVITSISRDPKGHVVGVESENLTKSTIGLSSVTNNAQVKGLASGTTENHVVTWGADGYSVKDSGFTIAKNVPSDAKFTDTDTKVTAAEYHYTPETNSGYTIDLNPSGVKKIITSIQKDSKGHVTGVTSVNFSEGTIVAKSTSGTGGNNGLMTANQAEDLANLKSALTWE